MKIFFKKVHSFENDYSHHFIFNVLYFIYDIFNNTDRRGFGF